MTPPAAALELARSTAGPSATIAELAPLAGGQHADTWRVTTAKPRRTVVLRTFPPGDPAAAHERVVLEVLGGLGGLAPRWLAGDPEADRPVSIISWLDGGPDITPADPRAWAQQLGRALAGVHAVRVDRVAGLPRVLDRRAGSVDALTGPLVAAVVDRWSQIAGAPPALAHCDFWSGNVVWRDGQLTGIVDWCSAAVGPTGFDVGWCRLDLVLLYGPEIADVFLDAYRAAAANRTAGADDVADVGLWDRWAAARSHDGVTSWAPNYQPLGRGDLDAQALRRRHRDWTQQLLARG